MAKEIAIKQDFTAEQIELIKNTIAKGASNDELNLFLYQARKTGLDPLAKQIHFTRRITKNGPVVTIITAIDGFRVIAERSGDYAGQDEPIFEKVQKFSGVGEDIKCSVKIYKWSPNGERYVAAVGVAYWSEYCPAAGMDFMWKKMPRTMLAKVAEALGLRKAFPQDLSGIYTSDEMQQAEEQKSTQSLGQDLGEEPDYDSNDDFGATKAKEAKKVKVVKTAEEAIEEVDRMFNK